MKENSILRLGFIVGDGQAENFDKNLFKIIRVVLYDCKKELSLYEISNQIKQNYDLTFSEEEIHSVIQNKKYAESFIEIGKDKFSLSGKSRDKLKTIESKYDIDRFIDQFKRETDTPEEPLYIKELITDFLYKTFLLNKRAVMNLLEKDSDEIAEQLELNNEKKLIINRFLNWNNHDKDVFIYNTISYCVDYCQLTVKKNSGSFSSFFSGKVFTLDANVIFRLIGFNNDERKQVIDAFITRCQECNIKLQYTNFTYSEITTTIAKKVQAIRINNNGRRPISYKNQERFSGKDKNLDLLKIYISWYASPSNRYNDYKAFEKYLKSLVDKQLHRFNKKDIYSYKTVSEREFDSLSKSLIEYKSQHSKYFSEYTIETDINNFIFVSEERKREKGNNGFNINNYLITTDSRLCNWSAETYPGAVPICVLPSVWYSLLLKYQGRTDDDYRAFCLFLNMRYRIEDDEISKKKEDILAYVKSLDEPTEIKEKILDNIYDGITQMQSISIDDPENIVEEAIKEVKAEEIEEYLAKYGQNVANNYEVINQMARKQVDKKQNALKCVKQVVNAMLIIFLIVFVALIIYLFASKKLPYFLSFFTNRDLGIDFTHYVAFIDGCGFIISTVINVLIKNRDKLEYEDQVEKEKQKIIKKYSL